VIAPEIITALVAAFPPHGILSIRADDNLYVLRTAEVTLRVVGRDGPTPTRAFLLLCDGSKKATVQELTAEGVRAAAAALGVSWAQEKVTAPGLRARGRRVLASTAQ